MEKNLSRTSDSIFFKEVFRYDLSELPFKLKDSCNDLGIPIVSVEESSSYPIVIFASEHNHYKTEPYDIKEILLQKLKNGKKTIVGFEFLSDFEDVLNDPAKNLTDNKLNNILSFMEFRKTIRGLIEVFNEIQQKYSIDRFEIKPFDVTYAEEIEFQFVLVAQALSLAMQAKTLEEHNPLVEILKNRNAPIINNLLNPLVEILKNRNALIVNNLLDLLRTYEDNNNLVVYTGAAHVIGLLTKLKEIIKSENKDRIAVVLSREG